MVSELPRYASKSVREAGKQFYVDANGDRIPSVTTILNATKPREDRERLFNWQQRVGVEQATEITKTASRRGTGTHRYIQKFLQGQEVDCPETIRPYWESVEPVLKEIEQVRLIEGVVIHDQLGYAGVVDCVASYEGVPCICEWKTSDRPKKTVDRLYDYPLQLVAYCGAVNQLYREYSLNLCHALLVVAIPETPAEIFWFEPSAIDEYWQQWEARVQQYWRRLGYFRN
ncbi:PD-(D/E)XK nuclease family protein [Leptolyngbya sp. FACHB-17]|uniref:PD-(D/E)XK nuclease family protein n=1 Tax=unclassified Leptolyngbya TaxID=2650499 RepID=UPI0016807048|nr:PD-(D/E)XK nuclease family protein [Leptolyngbya sp. FACHB-17]MBD2081446.1 exonuclease [Leptolyngbya sp. FACHB-17]